MKHSLHHYIMREPITRLLQLLILFFSANLPALEHPSQLISKEAIIQQIYQFVDQRNPTAAIFEHALNHPDPEIQRGALLGLGRIGGKAIINKVAPFLDHSDESLRQLAAFALGISANKEAAFYLWQRLEKEIAASVKKEIYLGLGNLGQNNLISKMMERLTREKSIESQAYLFQGLGIALTFHKDLKDDFSQLDFTDLLIRFGRGDKASPIVGFFIDRIPEIESMIKADELLELTQSDYFSHNETALMATIYLTRLIGKITTGKHESNRALLAWIIEKSNSSHLSLKLEATRALRNLMYIPQALIQLGKLHASSNPIIAQTALKVIADSELDTEAAIKLLKNQLKSQNASMVVDAISGLVKRQQKEDMSWVVKLFNHPDPYVKISLMRLLKDESNNEFDNVIRFFTKDKQQEVSRYAQKMIAKDRESANLKAQSPPYAEAIKAAGKQAILKTTVGDIIIQLLPDAPFTSWHFVHNAEQGNFTNSYFSRVIGNFVAQGGDTIGDGNGSSGRTIREEISFRSHTPMTVGMATSGKDTGTSQFFINTGHNLHLDRNYTIFAKVVSGQGSVLRMTHGTKILEVIVRE